MVKNLFLQSEGLCKLVSFLGVKVTFLGDIFSFHEHLTLRRGTTKRRGARGPRTVGASFCLDFFAAFLF